MHWAGIGRNLLNHNCSVINYFSKVYNSCQIPNARDKMTAPGKYLKWVCSTPSIVPFSAETVSQKNCRSFLFSSVSFPSINQFQVFTDDWNTLARMIREAKLLGSYTLYGCLHQWYNTRTKVWARLVLHFSNHPWLVTSDHIMSHVST